MKTGYSQSGLKTSLSCKMYGISKRSLHQHMMSGADKHLGAFKAPSLHQDSQMCMHS